MGKHAQERTKQRYNIDLTYSDEKNILYKLKTGKGIPLDTECDEGLQFAYVVHRNVPLKVLYSLTENMKVPYKIVTVYPFDVDEYNGVFENDCKSAINKAVAFLKTNGYVVYKKGQK